MRPDLCSQLQKISLNHKRIMNQMLFKYGLTYAQYLALKEIESHPGVLAQNLIVLLDSDKATLSGIIKRLETANWLTKELDEDDRRKQHLFLTEKSTTHLASIQVMESRCEEILLHSLPPHNQTKLTAILNEIIDNQTTYLDKE